MKYLKSYKTKEEYVDDIRGGVCPQCGEIVERDYNAALNILDEGLRIIVANSPN